MSTSPTFFSKYVFIVLSFKALKAIVIVVRPYYTLDTGIFEGFFSVCDTDKGKEMDPFHFLLTFVFLTSLNFGIGQGEFKFWWDFQLIVCSTLKTFREVEFKRIRKNLCLLSWPISRGVSPTCDVMSRLLLKSNRGGNCRSQTEGLPHSPNSQAWNPNGLGLSRPFQLPCNKRRYPKI